MKLIQQLNIKNFKSIDNIELKNLKRINVIAGRNGKGKTSILEALFLSNDIASPDCLLKPIMFRGGIPSINEDLFSSYFKDRDTSKEISIAVTTNNGRKLLTSINIDNQKGSGKENINVISGGMVDNNSLSLRSSEKKKSIKIKLKDITEKNEKLLVDVTQTINASQITSQLTPHNNSDYANFATTFVTTSNKTNTTNTISIISELTKTKKKSELVENISMINKKIKDVDIIIIDGNPTIFFDIGEDKLVELSTMGEGVGRLLTIFAVSYFTKNGIILIDEIENGIHYTLIKKILKTILSQSLKNENQVFITTHSHDIVKFMGEMLSDGELSSDDISFTRIGYSEVKNKTVVNNFNAEEIKISTDDDWEIR